MFRIKYFLFITLSKINFSSLFSSRLQFVKIMLIIRNHKNKSKQQVMRKSSNVYDNAKKKRYSCDIQNFASCIIIVPLNWILEDVNITLFNAGYKWSLIEFSRPFPCGSITHLLVVVVLFYCKKSCAWMLHTKLRSSLNFYLSPFSALCKHIKKWIIKHDWKHIKFQHKTEFI